MLAAGRLPSAGCSAEGIQSCADTVCQNLENSPAIIFRCFQRRTRAAGWQSARAQACGRGWCARSRGPFPSLSLPGFPLSCRARPVAASGRSAVKRDPVSAPCHVLRSFGHVSEPRALGAPAPGL